MYNEMSIMNTKHLNLPEVDDPVLLSQFAKYLDLYQVKLQSASFQNVRRFMMIIGKYMMTYGLPKGYGKLVW